MKSNKRAFTIVELVIVIAVIAVLAAVLIPTFTTMVKNSKHSAALQACTNAMREYTSEYSVQHQGSPLPDGIVFEKDGYLFVHMQGALVEAQSGKAEDNLAQNLTFASSIEGEKLATNYQLYQLDEAGFGVVQGYLSSRSGKRNCTYYTDTKLTVNGNPTNATYVLRVEYKDVIYLVGVHGDNLGVDGQSNIYGATIMGQHNSNAPNGTFVIENTPTPPTPQEPTLTSTIKNIIYLIPDGAGYGTYDMANALKSTYGSGVYGQATPITTNAIAGKTVTGLYLDDYMIASADTNMAHLYGTATDSAAAGTALLCGQKTDYLMVGVTPDFAPCANILELCRLEGKSTGFVTTKCLVDATPSDGLSHSLKRGDQDNSAYQRSMSQQILYSGADVVLCYGSDGGYYAKAKPQQEPLHNDRAANHGYTVVSDLETLNAAVEGGATKLFSNIQIDYKALNDTGEYNLTASNYYTNSYDYNTDYQAFHILYDCDAKLGVDLTLMDMAKAALTTLATNINDSDGFCLVIEGGAIDNAAEGRNVREAVAEYLAFDEVFAYCVNWAMGRDDTIVVACPDHDSGGLYLPNNTAGYADEAAVLEALHNGSMAHNTKLAGAANGHSPQNVPVWLYAPDTVRAEIIEALELPADTDKTKVRTGRYYDGTTFDPDYAINNSDIAHAVVAAAGLCTFAEATAELFVDATPYGTYNTETEIFTFTNGEYIKRNTNYYQIGNKDAVYIFEGVAIYPTNEASYTTYDGTSTKYTTVNTVGGKFYVPKSVLVTLGYVTP